MHVGIIGLERIGANIARRVVRHGHAAIACDREHHAVAALARQAAVPATRLELGRKLGKPRAIWPMLPTGEITQGALLNLVRRQPGAGVIDAGQRVLARRHWPRRGTQAAPSAGRRRHNQRRGVGTRAPVLLEDRQSPGPDLYGRRPRDGQYARILWARWAACAEVFDILKNASCEALPEAERFNLDIADIAEVWRRGNAITSWSLNLAAAALTNVPRLDAYSGFVEDSDDGGGTGQAAIDEAMEVDVLPAAPLTRFLSRRFAEKTLFAMRQGFGQPKALQP